MLALALLALVLQQTEPALPAPPPAPAAPAAPRPPSPPRAPRAQAGAPERPLREEPVLKGFEKRSGKRFTGDFRETDVEDALRRIADAGDWSIVLPPGRHGEISARFKNTPVEDALAAVLSQAGLVATRDGTIVTVRPRTGQAGEADVTRRDADGETRRTPRERRAKDRVVRGDVVVHAGKAERDVVAIRGSIKVEPGGEVRDAVAILGSVTLEPGAHARQAVAVGGNVKLGPGAQIDRDVVSVGGDVQRDAGAEIGGNTVSVGIPAVAGLVGVGALLGHDHSPTFAVGQVLAKFLVYFALGLLVLALFPRRVEAVSASFTAQPLKSVLSGLLGVVLLPILIVLLIATVIGILLVPVAGFLVIAAGVLGFTALAYYIGRAVPIRIERGTNVLQLALGTAIVVLVTAIPFLGSMAWIAAMLLTFGAVLRSRFGSHGPVLATTAVPPPAPPPAAAT